MNGRLYRHPTDKVIGGVAAGIGAWMGIDPTIVRIAWVVLAIFTSGVFLVIYVVMLFVVPLAPAGWTPPEGRPLTGGGTPGWGQPGAQPGAQPGWGQQGSGQQGAQPGGWQAPGGGWSPDAVTGGNAGIIAGVILIALGTWFLIERYVDIDWSLLWPVMLMLGGIGIIVAVSRRARPPG